MEFAIETEEFKEALRLCSSMHVSANDVLITAKKKGNKSYVIVESAESGSYVKYKIPAKVTDEGSTCVNLSQLNGLRIGSVLEVKLEANKLEFKSGNMKGGIQISQERKKVESQRPIKLFDPETFIPGEMLKRVVATTRLQPSGLSEGDILGLKFITNGRYVTAYCSEHYRACLYKAKMPNKLGAIDAILKPNIMAALTSKMSKDVMIGLNNGMFQVKSGGMTCYIPTIQREDIEDIPSKLELIEKETAKGRAEIKAEFEVDCEELIRTISSTTSIVVGMLTQGVKLNCSIRKKLLRLDVKSQSNRASNKLKINGGPSKEVKIILVSKYLLEMLSLLGKGKIKFKVYNNFIMFETKNSEACMFLATSN